MMKLVSAEEIAYQVLLELSIMKYWNMELVEKVVRNRCRREGLDNQIEYCWGLVKDGLDNPRT